MKTTFKYVFKFIESNARLSEKKVRTKTLELPRELFDHYDVDGMVKAFRSAAVNFTQHDSNVAIKAVKVGHTEFQL